MAGGSAKKERQKEKSRTGLHESTGIKIPIPDDEQEAELSSWLASIGIFSRGEGLARRSDKLLSSEKYRSRTTPAESVPPLNAT